MQRLKPKLPRRLLLLKKLLPRRLLLLKSLLPRRLLLLKSLLPRRLPLLLLLLLPPRSKSYYSVKMPAFGGHFYFWRSV